MPARDAGDHRPFDHGFVVVGQPHAVVAQRRAARPSGTACTACPPACGRASWPTRPRSSGTTPRSTAAPARDADTGSARSALPATDACAAGPAHSSRSGPPRGWWPPGCRPLPTGAASGVPAVVPAGTPSGLAGQPVVLPDGHVIVPYDAAAMVRSFRSTDGGASWSSSVLIASISHHQVGRGAARRAATVGRRRRRRHRIRGMVALPVPDELLEQRHRHRQVDQRDQLGRAGPGAHQASLQHGRPPLACEAGSD